MTKKCMGSILQLTQGIRDQNDMLMQCSNLNQIQYRQHFVHFTLLSSHLLIFLEVITHFIIPSV